MALDRWIALIILGIALAYGYAAFFTMDQLLPPFMQRNPIWPSTFPKVLAVLSILTAAIIVLGLEKPSGEVKTPDIDYRRLGDYNIGQAALLLGLMVAYALLLRPAGFLLSTSGFLIVGAMILGERKLWILIPVAAVATGIVWYLVEGVLGIFLRPLPFFLG
ncbi:MULTISPECIES: tripartite tricarboxylate transporter TctB family protein [unclassified Epibacterium]|jgi:putative tricarboxylic transport membrane protein|uniref:tripartite tricarboxylate transporter TctB family protein n=1 Tax=unclassified Epibacterium TaxID=2639179 RepID=UPI001EF73A24|nr:MULTISPECIES: tripartite tricarboxylate transporter TctB family protein [unclassified Epibacterium]MCG7621782.1 tripartite tricarboxylate transporter TctB family protein [Epibacterium sp. Ofav1-8]MCG7627229.1 tripartite tricarboxylate transporter TctB family protein [Epibacterium sp. MM17-32]